MVETVDGREFDNSAAQITAAKENAEKRAREKADREAKRREEEEKKKHTTSEITSATPVKNNDRSREIPALSQKGELAGTWDPSAADKDQSSGLPPISTPSVPGGTFDGIGNPESLIKKVSPGGPTEEVKLHASPKKKGKRGVKTPSNLSKVATPSETTDMNKLDVLEGQALCNVSARVSISSENERLAEAERGPSPPPPTQPALAPEVTPEVPSDSTSELLKTPQGVEGGVPTTPKLWPTPSEPQISGPAPTSANTEPKKPLSLWELQKLKAATQPANASNLLGDYTRNTSSSREDADGGNTKTTAMPTITVIGDRKSSFTDAARDQKRENQREHLVEGFLGFNQGRRRNDSAQPQITTKPPPRLTPAPAHRSSGWELWGGSLLSTISASSLNMTGHLLPNFPWLSRRSGALQEGLPPVSLRVNRPGLVH